MVRIRQIVMPAALLVGLSFGVAGCGSTTVTDSSGHKAVIKKDGDKVTVKDSEGNTFTTGGDLPKDFPKGDVPLISGDIAASMSGAAAGAKNGDQGWSVQIKSKKSGDDCFSEASSKLTGKGFTKKGDSSIGSTHNAQFQSSAYVVVLTASDIPGVGCLASYLVGPTPGS